MHGSKLQRPDPPPFAVGRERLVRLLEAGARKRMTLVAAPAGFGKSVLVCQWASERASPVGWIRFDERDRDPIRYATHLLAAAAAGGAGDAVALRSTDALRATPSRIGDDFVDHLVDDLDEYGGDVVLVLEDLDELAGTAGFEATAQLILASPANVHFVAVCRADPNMPLHRLRTRDELLEIRAADLRFTGLEATALIEELAGHHLDEEEVDHLLRHTEGWPVAVQLAAVNLRDNDGSGILSVLGPVDRDVVGYLSAEVLARESSSVRSFLLDVSVLDELSAELCDAVTGRRDSGRMLADLEERALFVSRMSEPGRYRLHRLVREILRHELRLARPDRPRQLLRRAATWSEDTGRVGQAAAYLIDSADWEGVTRFIDRYGRRFWEQGRARTVLSWAEAMPESVTRSDVRFRLNLANLQILSGFGDVAAAQLTQLEQQLPLTEEEQLLADGVLSATIFSGNPLPDGISRIDRALTNLRAHAELREVQLLSSTDWRYLACILETMSAVTRIFFGDGAAAEAAARAAAAPIAAPPIHRVNAFGAKALTDVLSGRLASARIAAGNAREVAGALAPDHPSLITAVIAEAIASRRQGDLEAAAALADSAVEDAVRWRRGPFVGLAVAERAEIDLARGDPQAAAEWVRRAWALSVAPPPPHLAGRLRSVQVRAHLAAGDLARAQELVGRADAAFAGWELTTAAVLVSLAAGDPAAATKHLADWPAGASPFGDDVRALLGVLTDHASGALLDAREGLDVLLRRTEQERDVGLFVEAGPPVAALFVALADQLTAGWRDVVVRRIGAAEEGLRPLVDPISDRELDVLRLLPTRMNNAGISDTLCISANTVKTHLRHIYQKLGADSRDDAVRRARRHGLL